jgi:hypothetical protein
MQCTHHFQVAYLPTPSVALHKADLSDYNNFDWDNDAFGICKHHPVSSLEQNEQEWQLAKSVLRIRHLVIKHFHIHASIGR